MVRNAPGLKLLILALLVFVDARRTSTTTTTTSTTSTTTPTTTTTTTTTTSANENSTDSTPSPSTRNSTEAATISPPSSTTVSGNISRTVVTAEPTSSARSGTTSTFLPSTNKSSGVGVSRTTPRSATTESPASPTATTPVTGKSAATIKIESATLSAVSETAAPSTVPTTLSTPTVTVDPASRMSTSRLSAGKFASESRTAVSPNSTARSPSLESAETIGKDSSSGESSSTTTVPDASLDATVPRSILRSSTSASPEEDDSTGRTPRPTDTTEIGRTSIGYTVHPRSTNVSETRAYSAEQSNAAYPTTPTTVAVSSATSTTSESTAASTSRAPETGTDAATESPNETKSGALYGSSKTIANSTTAPANATSPPIRSAENSTGPTIKSPADATTGAMVSATCPSIDAAGSSTSASIPERSDSTVAGATDETGSSTVSSVHRATTVANVIVAGSTNANGTMSTSPKSSSTGETTTTTTTSNGSVPRTSTRTTIAGSSTNGSSIARSSPDFDYVVVDEATGVPCILSTMSIGMKIFYVRTDGTLGEGTLTVPRSARSSGICNDETSQTKLTWSASGERNDRATSGCLDTVVFNFVKNASTSTLDSVSFAVCLDEENFPRAADETLTATTTEPLGLFATTANSGRFVCDQVTNINAGDISANIANVSLIAFNEDRNVSSKQAENCVAESRVDRTGVIGGIAGLVVAASVAVICLWRKKSSPRDSSTLP